MAVLRVEVPDDVAARLQQLAGERDMSPEAVLADALQWYLQDEAALDAAIAEGEADAAAGRIVAAEEVFANLRSIIADARTRDRR